MFNTVAAFLLVWISVHAQTLQDTNLLLAAAQANDLGVRAALANGANPNTKDRNGYTAVHLAAKSDCLPCLQQLASKGADLGARFSEQRITALMIAASQGSVAATRFLLAEGQMADDRTADGVTAEDFARTPRENEPESSRRRRAEVLAILSSPDAVRRASSSVTATYLIRCSLDCRITVDGEAQGYVSATQVKRISLSLGDHVVTVKALDGSAYAERVVSVATTAQEIVDFKLVPLNPKLSLLEGTWIATKQENKCVLTVTRSTPERLGSGLQECANSDGTTRTTHYQLRMLGERLLLIPPPRPGGKNFQDRRSGEWLSSSSEEILIHEDQICLVFPFGTGKVSEDSWCFRRQTP